MSRVVGDLDVPLTRHAGVRVISGRAPLEPVKGLLAAENRAFHKPPQPLGAQIGGSPSVGSGTFRGPTSIRGSHFG